MELFNTQFGRTYLETYYPNVFDEDSFLKALTVFEKSFLLNTHEPLDINSIVEQYELPHEIVENAAVFFHLLSVAEEIISSSREPIDTILDLGGGPTIYQHIAFSLITKSIIHADPLEENRKEVVNFINQKSEAYNWDAYFRAVLQYLLSRSSMFPNLSRQLNTWNIKDIVSWQTRVRHLLRDRVVPCDVFLPGMEAGDGDELSRALADSGVKNGVNMVTSHFLLESAASDMITWRKGMNHISSMLLPGGFLSMMAIRHAEWYRSGENRIPAVSIDEISLKHELALLGFSLSHLRFFGGSKKEDVGYDGMVFLLARKHVA